MPGAIVCCTSRSCANCGKRPQNEDDEPHEEKQAPVVLEQALRGRLAQKVDDLADEAQDGDLDQRGEQPARHQRGEKRPRLPTIAPVVADQRSGRLRLVMVAKDVDQRFEFAKHGLASSDGRDGRDAALWRK